jgi:hypothetical protein
MKSYDLYLYDPDQKLVIGWHAFERQHDEAAIEYAEALTQSAPMELWEGRNLLKTWSR